MYQCVAEVLRCEAVNEFVYLVELELPEAVDYIPGQYLLAVMGERDQRPFSIASTPADGQRVVLHIGASPDNPYAWEVLEHIRSHGELNISLPHGEAGYDPDRQRPLLLIAGGTGFSYTWSILQAHLARESEQPVTLFWGVRQASDLYMHQQLTTLASQYGHFEYIPVLEKQDDADWVGHQGLVLNAVTDHVDDIARYDVYIAGRFEMVRVARDTFHALGLPKQQLFGDALSFI
ncbi:NAD(P)H-flavin reductase [Aliidiomarina halalkaliphila]|uniref:NAD(P)H-flavin reductase n=1 Tax=Aliidiomarina halalkaliphila TaxID=2593535 RepID=A0A552X0Q6_9GAMM|nr:NAD(P)H-flavin reductase [Aliidiomarina halalkaliphila]TRW48469.1 NAD(P)H-flavin reductase [Aliidiomarina halalkaliphila]